MDIFVVNISKNAIKSLRRVPRPILDKFQSWVEAIELEGLLKVRKLPGFHDEPLKGIRKGQRSVRLNRSYRVIYIVKGNNIEFIEVLEVNNHEY